jgi:prohibitin 1
MTTVLRYLSLTIFGLATGLFLALALSGCSVVRPGNKGVGVVLGKVQTDTLDEGFYLWVPFIKSVKTLSIRVQKHAVETSAASKDMQEVKAHLAINWHIDPLKIANFYEHIGTEDIAVENIIIPAANEVMKSSTAKKTAEEILTKRAELKAEIDASLRTWLAQYGVLVDDVSLVDVTFTREFSHAVELKQIAEQEAKQAEYVALKAIKQAEAEVNRAKGQAEAQKLIQVSTTPLILQQKAIDKWNGVLPQIMGGNSALPFINLKLPKATKNED